MHTDDDQPWLGAAGWRQKGSPEDFYVDLGKQCERARRDYNRENRASLTTNTLTDWMLPTDRDQRRLVAEQNTAAAQEYREVVPQLVRDAILTGEEQQAEVSGYSIAVVVGGEPADSTYVGIVITGRVNVGDHAVILKQAPGADPTAWFPDAMPHRDVRAGEVVWSNFLDVDFLNGVLAGE